jgi:hypothetical protein
MPEYLFDFFVLSEGGKVIYSNPYVLQPADDQMIGAFFAALNAIHNMCFQSDLQKVSLNKYRLHFLKKEPFFFLGISSTNVKFNLANDNFESLAHRFYDNYQKDLPYNWQSDVGLFKDFKTEINKSLKEIVLEGFDSAW